MHRFSDFYFKKYIFPITLFSTMSQSHTVVGTATNKASWKLAVKYYMKYCISALKEQDSYNDNFTYEKILCLDEISVVDIEDVEKGNFAGKNL